MGQSSTYILTIQRISTYYLLSLGLSRYQEKVAFATFNSVRYMSIVCVDLINKPLIVTPKYYYIHEKLTVSALFHVS